MRKTRARRQKPLSQARRVQLDTLHNSRTANTAKVLEAAIRRLEDGNPINTPKPVKWTLANLAREACRNVATLHRVDPVSGKKVFAAAIDAFHLACAKTRLPAASDQKTQAEQSKRRVAELETKQKEQALAQLLEQNLQLAHRVRLATELDANYKKAIEEIRTLRHENERLKFELEKRNETAKSTDSAPQ